MKIKKINRLFFYNKRPILFELLLLPVMFVTFNLSGAPYSKDYTLDINNPFHDIFYLYNNDKKYEAIKLLKKEFNDNKFKNQAFINYGQIKEDEEKFPEAEKYYSMALKNNERMSIVYLLNLYRNHDKEKMMHFLNKTGNEDNCWILYEKAVNYAENNEKEKAFKNLTRAVDTGFISADLLLNDPAFNILATNSRYKKLTDKAKKVYLKAGSISLEMIEADYNYKKDKPYGTINEINAAFYFEKSGKYEKASNILRSLNNEKLSFRDKSIVLFRLASISARNGKKKEAKQYLQNFIDHLKTKEIDDTGYKDNVVRFHKDIILNNQYLVELAD